MRAVFLALVMAGWLSVTVQAAGPKFLCFDTDSQEAFPVAKSLTRGEFFSGKMPSIDYDADHHPTGLSWDERSETEDFRIEQIGIYEGNAIYRCTYRQRDQPAGDRPTFDWIVFGYEVSNEKEYSIRPFCIVNGDAVGTFEDYFEFSRRKPFVLQMNKTLSGTGGIYFTYTFAFAAREARLQERSEGGRHSPARTYRYSRTGKAVLIRETGEN